MMKVTVEMDDQKFQVEPLAVMHNFHVSWTKPQRDLIAAILRSSADILSPVPAPIICRGDD